MKIRASLIKLVVFGALSLLVLAVMWNTLSNVTAGGTTSYTAKFTDASGLREGDAVRIAGVSVGRVDGVELGESNLAEVQFTVGGGQPVYENTKILIRYQNLIGQRYLSLRPGPGRAKPLADGAVVPARRTESAFDLSVLMNGFDPLFDVLSPQDINRLSDTIVKVLQGEGGTIETLLTETARVTNKIADKDELIGRVITNMSKVLTHLSSKDEQFEDLIGKMRALVGGLADNRKAIGGALDGMNALAGSMTDLLGDARPAFQRDMAKANRVAGIYARERKSFEKVLVELPDFVEAAGRPFQYGSWLNIYACHLDVSVLGAEAGLLPGVGGHQHSAVCR